MGYNVAVKSNGSVMQCSLISSKTQIMIAYSFIIRPFTIMPSLHQTQITMYIYVSIYFVNIIYAYKNS